MNFSGRVTAFGTEYLGIPFATAARFQSPVDVALSQLPTNFSATQFGACCPQPPAVYVPSQSEDCLNLNVFTPQNSSAAKNRSRDSALESSLSPVLFFIHGGGGTTGCSAQSLPPLYNGTDLLSRSKTPVVVVTINYRLSVLGTLYIEGGIPDQLAVRDMISALRWVQKYIHLFGGDSSRVLIFGESAGGNSVQQLAITPGAGGLFHHVISESGTFYLATGFGNKTTATAAGRDVAASLNCTQDAAIDIVECLNKIPTNIIKDSSGMTQLPSVVGAELLPQYPAKILETGTGVSSSLKSMTLGWNLPDNFYVCGSSQGREAGPTQAVAYLQAQIPLWTSASSSDVANLVDAYDVGNCLPASSGGGSVNGSELCCAVVDALMLDATMRCPAYRNLRDYSTRLPNQQFLFKLNCCPTCPAPAGGLDCVCQHTSELQCVTQPCFEIDTVYVFGNPRSNYESSTTNVTCSAEPDFRPFSDDIIAAWVEIVSSGSHPSAWPPAVASSDLTAPPKLYYLNELAAGGPAFSARTEDSTFVTRCQMWDSVDAAAAVRKGLVPEQPSNAPAPAPAPVTPTPSPGNIVLTEWVIVGLVIAIAMVLGLVVVGIMFAVKRKRSTTRTATTYLASSTSSEQAASSRDTGNTEKLLK